MYQPRPQPRSGKATAVKVAAAFGALALVGIAGVAVASSCGYALYTQKPVGMEPVEAVRFREQLPAILRRQNVEDSIPGLQPYDYSVPVDTVVSGSVVSGGAAAHATGDDVSSKTGLPVGVSVPVMTNTSVNTVYSMHTMEPITTSTTTLTTTTLTTTITIVPSTTHSCKSSKPDETETVLVTVTVIPKQSQAPGYTTPSGDVTVTGDPATVTDVQTDISYTSGAPDATVTGDPATVTNVQTDVSYTSGAPDVTVSGEPATVTSVITNTAGEPMTTLTFTSIHTVITTVTTVTRTRGSSVDFNSSVLGLPHSVTSGSPSRPVTTHTETVTVSNGPPVTSTTTIELPAPYGDGYPTSYGTGLPINVTTSPTYVPPVVSAGTEGCGRSVAYLVMAAIAAVCFM
ncbi:hypothetical protein BBO_02274 [Beauveria brongniartii RCEF 3172]|uniref:Uncharacterized protein n=1 Tax=Beauveria brongniartii RCEF 3172 TaxID=1081107 RepID=A0A167HK56_9HYPO|nr:hypothetical protein BBO_02274 [Beauveria brongniartii RCEF 3172]